ncbi:hypothetical protein NQ314_010871 [Rhamnusium bicolor]|uniref:Phosphatidate cytidylyltransferase, mitochondrial n=1 Tax=Rhamnusium bicolor TaxID=1586634 RepID=A0AAV8XM99_9CUCU|nr:hypothetical protein NQ314_010871 [Rhamnusium bicolor]
MASTKVTIIPPIYKRILSKFPQNFTFCFAYGSAVKKQLQNKTSENLIDLIFCVNNPSAWHEANLKHNSSHYSGVKYFGHNFISRYQQNFGAKVYFNTLVPLDDIWIKYGVVATDDLVTDLLEWSDLYLAGRLHKPVEIIIKPLSSELETALQLNLQSAVHAALLILPDSFTEYEFYHTISNLSYSGDFRMTFGENKNKVENIVKPQLLGFRQLYQPFILSLPDYVDFPMFKEEQKVKEALNNENAMITKVYDSNEPPVYCAQDVSPIAKLHHLNQLPRWPQKALTRFWNRGTLRQDTEDVLRAIAYDPDCGLIVKQCISDIVWKSSVSQSLKSIVTAGLLKKLGNMYQLSDSDSVDSDEGIRYKTESIRNKSRSSETDSPSSKKDSDHHKYRERKRSRSPRYCSYNESKMVKTEKKEQPEDDFNRKIRWRESDRHKVREDDKRDTRKHKEREKTKRKSQSETQLVKRTSEHCKEPNLEKVEESTSFGPALPPKKHKISDVDRTEDENKSIGPEFPAHLKIVTCDENAQNEGKNQLVHSSETIGPDLPHNFKEIHNHIESTLPKCTEESNALIQNHIVGPALPPHLLKKNLEKVDLHGPTVLSTADERANKTIGPAIPPHLRQKLLEESSTVPGKPIEEGVISEDDEVYGPIPVGENYSKAHIKLEERALQIKMDQLQPAEDKQPGREEWMLSLPEAKAASFGTNTEPSVDDEFLPSVSIFMDGSPEDKAKKKAGKVEPKVDLQREAELKEIRKKRQRTRGSCKEK